MEQRLLFESNGDGPCSHGDANSADVLGLCAFFILNPLPHRKEITILPLSGRHQAVLGRTVSVVSHVEEDDVEASIVQPRCWNQHLVVRFAGTNTMDDDDPGL